MKVAALVSMLPTALTQAQRDQLRSKFEWVVLNQRGGRVLIDIQGDSADLVWLRGRLQAASLDPITIAVFRQDTGRRLPSVPIDVAAFLAVAPDIVTGYDGQGAPIFARPTSYAQVHTWLGWTTHTDQE